MSTPTPSESSRTASSGGGLSKAIWVLLILLLVLLLPYIAEQTQYHITRGKQRAEADAARAELVEPPDFANVYSRVVDVIEPSVVGVKTTRVVRGRADELSHLFGRTPLYQAKGEGSGVIVDEAGYVLTNFHVINQASEVVVELADGRTIRDVSIVGADPLTDVAVLKIGAGDLDAARWGDSEALEVGAPVVAVGNPFGLERTVTAGIISAKGRRGIVENLSYQDFLQTDAAVNPGNSGGPLVNLRGEVVGINTAIVGPRYQGVSFAIPSKLARDVYQRLKTTGHVARGWLGVLLQELNEQLAERLGLEEPRGALVTNVLPDSPAAKAGIEPGDVILRWNDEPVADPTELAMAVARTKIGAAVSVTLIRDGREQTLEVTVTERPPSVQQ